MMLSSLLTMPIAVFDRFRQHCGRIRSCQNDSDNYLAMVGSNSPLSRLAALKDILKSEDYVAAVSNLLLPIKRLLLMQV